MIKQLEESDELYKQAYNLKDVARKDDFNLDKYTKASSLYQEASNKLLNAIPNFKDKNIIVKIKSLLEYYLYEAYDCSYAYQYKNRNFEEAISNATKAKLHINNSLNIINENISTLDKDTKKELLKYKQNYTLYNFLIRIKIIEPKAKQYFENKDYISAMDSYNEMDKIQDEIFNYLENSELEEVSKRIQKGNYYASKASIANTKIGILDSKEDTNDYNEEILEQLLNAYKYIQKAFKANPEWTTYKNGIEITKDNLIKFLKENIDDWELFCIQFNNDKILETIMREIDLKKFKDSKGETSEININKSEIWRNMSMTKKITLLASIGTIITTIAIFFPNPVSSNQTTNGNQSPNIQTSNGDTTVSYGNKTTNNYYKNKSENKLYLQSTMLFKEASILNNKIKSSLCTVESGSEVKLIEEKNDSTITSAVWVKVKVLNGTCKGTIGWTGKEKLIRK